MPRKQGRRTSGQAQKDGRGVKKQIDQLKNEPAVRRFQQDIIESVKRRRNRHREFDVEEFDAVDEGFLLALSEGPHGNGPFLQCDWHRREKPP